MGKLKGMQPLPKLRVPGPGGDGGAAAAAGTSQGAWAGMPSTDRSLPGSPSTFQLPPGRAASPGTIRKRMVPGEGQSEWFPARWERGARWS